MKTIFIANSCGHYDQLVGLIRASGFDKEKDKLIVIGNFINHGPQSLKSLLMLRKLQEVAPSNVFILKGIEERLFVQNYNNLKANIVSEDYLKLSCMDGGLLYESLKLLCSEKDAQELVDWLNDLSEVYSDDRFIAIHDLEQTRDPIYRSKFGGITPKKQRAIFVTDRENRVHENNVMKLYEEEGISNYIPDGMPLLWLDRTYNDKIGMGIAPYTDGYPVIPSIVFEEDDSYHESYVIFRGKGDTVLSTSSMDLVLDKSTNYSKQNNTALPQGELFDRIRTQSSTKDTLDVVLKDKKARSSKGGR